MNTIGVIILTIVFVVVLSMVVATLIGFVKDDDDSNKPNYWDMNG